MHLDSVVAAHNIGCFQHILCGHHWASRVNVFINTAGAPCLLSVMPGDCGIGTLGACALPATPAASAGYWHIPFTAWVNWRVLILLCACLSVPRSLLLAFMQSGKLIEVICS